MAKASSSQIKKIYAMARELNLDSELLHTFIFNLLGNEHISALTGFEANKAIDELEYKKTGKRQPKTFIKNMVTDDQKLKIKALERELGWQENPKRLKAFMKKYTRVENEKWLTFGGASNLIEALKKVLERERLKKLST